MRIAKDDWKDRSVVPSTYYRSSLKPFDYTPLSVYSPIRSRLFDTTWFDYDDISTRLVENRFDNTLEYHIPTGTDIFKPGDLTVNVRGRDVEVKARREEKSYDGNSYVLKELRRTVRVPYGVDVNRATAEIRGGKIILKAPVREPYLSEWNRDYRYPLSKVW